MDEIACEHSLRVGKLYPGGLTAADYAIFNPHILHLLSEDHTFDMEIAEGNALAIEDPQGMAAMFIDRHAADLHVCRTVWPLPDMKRPNDFFASQERDVIASSSNQLDFLFTMDRYILKILARLDEHRVALLGHIDGFLNRREVPRAIEGNNDRTRF